MNCGKSSRGELNTPHGPDAQSRVSCVPLLSSGPAVQLVEEVGHENEAANARVGLSGNRGRDNAIAVGVKRKRPAGGAHHDGNGGPRLGARRAKAAAGRVVLHHHHLAVDGRVDQFGTTPGPDWPDPARC